MKISIDDPFVSLTIGRSSYSFVDFLNSNPALTSLLSISIAGIAAVFSLRRAYHSPRFTKSVDLINDFDKRYDSLYAEKMLLLKPEENSPRKIDRAIARSYFTRFWSLQESQFNFFLIGVIDPYVYSNWIVRKIMLFRTDDVLPGWGAQDSWKEFGISCYQQSTLFVIFVEKIRAYSILASRSADDDEEYARSLVYSLYTSTAAKKYRKSVATRGPRWDVEELSELKYAFGDYARDSTIVPFQNSKGFSAAVSHEKKNIIGPFLTNKFYSISPGCKILDFGCGPFHLGMALLTAGFDVSGYDPVEDMINTSANNYGKLVSGRLESKPTKLKKDFYDITLLSFVHQIAETKDLLRLLLQRAIRTIKPGGKIVLIGADPENLAFAFSSVSHSVSGNMHDGDLYETTIYDEDGVEAYKAMDYFYSIETLKSILFRLGITQFEHLGIKDVKSKSREANPEGKSPYFYLSGTRL